MTQAEEPQVETSQNEKPQVEITKDMLIAEVIQRKPRTIQPLMLIGMGCIGCPSSMMETVEQAAWVHGVDPDVLVQKLNEV
ncbi:MAG: DUF1858 domain-containing protein [Peptoniphilaceae bacterium]|nr:DUF1858 domain-containing protein [Peptoniphilaceae bacterium]MDY6085479.1 DUF1858 domain-containing protein [Peptoniphilaceae bacterium]